MSHPGNESVPPELLPLVERLREERPEASVLELDVIKLRVIAQAGGNAPAKRRQGRLRSRVVSLVVVFGLLAGGTAAVAGSGGPFQSENSNSSSAGRSQYCPPDSHGGVKPKERPAKCGH
jgi:hypothetical protein